MYTNFFSLAVKHHKLPKHSNEYEYFMQIPAEKYVFLKL